MTTMLSAVIVAAAFLGADETKSELKAGAATVDVTPPIGIPMWGYGSRRDKPSTGVKDRLEANAVVIEVVPERVALVGLDIGRAPNRKSMARIRERVKKDSGITHVMIVGSHTHHGPCLELEDVPSPSDSYVHQLEEKIAGVIGEAVKKLQPAAIGVGRTEKPHNRNRHKAHNAVDRELAVIRIDDLEGKPIATVVNFAAHPTMISDKVREYSADWPGAMKRQVEKEIGGVCAFMQGAAGDMSVNADGKNYVQFGTIMGQEVAKLHKTIEPRRPAKPSIKAREEDLKFDQLRIDLTNPAIKGVYTTAFFKKLVDFYTEEYSQGVRPHLTVVLLNDEIGLVGASGEFFARHSLELKRRSRLPHTLFFGYCNDYQQYFPTIEAAAEGGYGADAAVSPSPIGAGETIMNRGLFHIYDLQGKYKFKLF